MRVEGRVDLAAPETVAELAQVGHGTASRDPGGRMFPMAPATVNRYG
jgi:hypothetical protein